MKTFALRNGDLVLTGDRYAMVEGAARLQQQVGLALSDPYRSDRFHPEWGSVLGSFIGSVYGEKTDYLVQAEVNRVVRAYIATQNSILRDRSMMALRPNISTSELVADLKSVQTSQQEDTMLVKVSILTSGKDQIDVLTTAGGA